MPNLPTYEDELDTRRHLVRRIRDRCRDYAELNRVVEGQEHSDRMIYHAIGDILDDFNAMAPRIGTFLAANFPNHQILIDGALSILLESSALLYSRNDLAYSHQGTQVQLRQAGDYLNIAQMFRQRYENKAKEWKVTQNMELAVGNSGSFYSAFILTYRPLWYVNSLSEYQSPL